MDLVESTELRIVGCIWTEKGLGYCAPPSQGSCSHYPYFSYIYPQLPSSKNQRPDLRLRFLLIMRLLNLPFAPYSRFCLPYVQIFNSAYFTLTSSVSLPFRPCVITLNGSIWYRTPFYDVENNITSIPTWRIRLMDQCACRFDGHGIGRSWAWSHCYLNMFKISEQT